MSSNSSSSTSNSSSNSKNSPSSTANLSSNSKKFEVTVEKFNLEKNEDFLKLRKFQYFADDPDRSDIGLFQDISKVGVLPLFCCLFTWILPIGAIAVIFGLSDLNSLSSLILFIVAVILILIGICYTLFILRDIFAMIISEKVEPEAINPWKSKEISRKIQVNKICLIMNPYGGQGRSRKLVDEIILPTWKECGIESVIIYHTEFVGHVYEYAKQLDISKFDALVGIGGDGTIHELVNGLLARKDKKKIPVGFLPGGSGNSLNLTLNNWDVKNAALRIAEGTLMLTDINQIELDKNHFIYSINTVCFGLPSYIGLLAEIYRSLGENRYTALAVWAIGKGSYEKLTLVYEDSKKSIKHLTRENLGSVVVNLNQHFGRGIRICPIGHMDDNRMDVLSVKRANRGKMVRFFLESSSGSHIKDNDTIHYEHLSSLNIKSSAKTFVCNIDGEMYHIPNRDFVSMKSVKKAIEIFSPLEVFLHQI